MKGTSLRHVLDETATGSWLMGTFNCGGKKATCI